MQRIRKFRPSAAMIVSCVALFMALGGVGYAAATIDGKSIKKRTIAGKKLIKNSVGGTAVKESALGKVPRAASADSATKAASADSATTSSTAATAANAANASALGGTPAGDFLQTGARGVAVAGATVQADGTVVSWFNRAGGAPTVEGGGDDDGNYQVIFPGLNLTSATHVSTANLVGAAGLVTVDYNSGELHMRTWDGNIAADTFDGGDHYFTVVVQASSAAG